MKYERTVKAAVAETQSKFKLAEALAIEIPPQRRGPKVGPAVTVTECLMDAALEIKRAGGEPRSWETLSRFRNVALWVSSDIGGNSTDERRLTFRWIKGVSFSAHLEAWEAGLSYDEFAAMPKKTVSAIRERAGTAKVEPTPETIVQSWTPQQRAEVVRQAVKADPVAAAAAADALDERWAETAKPQPRDRDKGSRLSEALLIGRAIQRKVNDFANVATGASWTAAERDALIPLIDRIITALEMVKVGVQSGSWDEQLADLLGEH